MDDGCAELMRFLRCQIDPADFPHREHVRMAFEMLRRHPFAETALHFSRAPWAMAAKAGRPQAYHETITIAFLSLVAERLEAAGVSDFAALERTNPDLLDKTALARWYSPERLKTDAARRTFLLPEPML